MNGERVHTVKDLLSKVQTDQEFRERLMQNPEAALRGLEDVPPQMLGWIYVGVIATLGVVVLAAIIGGIALSAAGKTVPDSLVALGSTALGGLVGLLARSPEEPR